MHFLPLTSYPASLLQEPSEVRVASPGARAETQRHRVQKYGTVPWYVYQQHLICPMLVHVVRCILLCLKHFRRAITAVKNEVLSVGGTAGKFWAFASCIGFPPWKSWLHHCCCMSWLHRDMQGLAWSRHLCRRFSFLLQSLALVSGGKAVPQGCSALKDPPGWHPDQSCVQGGLPSCRYSWWFMAQ